MFASCLDYLCTYRVHLENSFHCENSCAARSGKCETLILKTHVFVFIRDPIFCILCLFEVLAAPLRTKYHKKSSPVIWSFLKWLHFLLMYVFLHQRCGSLITYELMNY